MADGGELLGPGDVRSMLESALAHGLGLFTMADVEKGLIEGRYQLWVGAKSVCVSEMNAYPTGRKVLILFLAAGDPVEMNACLPGIEAWARGAGACAVMFWGRAPRPSAWERMMPGYSTLWTGQVKELR